MVLSIHRRNISYESVGQVIVHVPTMFASFLPLELSIKRNNPLILYNFKLERLLNINLCTIWYERLVKLQLQMPWSLVILLGGCCWFCWGFFSSIFTRPDDRKAYNNSCFFTQCITLVLNTSCPSLIPPDSIY